ncbi:MAG: glycosyltransferase family 39 protein [Myxococcota bacterium]
MLLVLAGTFVVLEIVSGLQAPYGLFHDEYYYWACARHPGLGYVDHPPLSGWVLAGFLALAGDSLPVFGILPALCGGTVVFLTGRIAARFGAETGGQALAALCAMGSAFLLAFFSFYSVNAFEILFWTLAGLLFVDLLRTRDPRLWLALGALAGVAMLNKHTVAMLFGAIGLAALLSPLRAGLRTRWPWLGLALALLLASPNLVWNAVNDWPSLAFYQSVGAEKNLPTSVADAILFQLVGTNPATALVWIPGVCALLVSARFRAWRPVGIAFLVLPLVMLTSGQRRGDRIVGAYPLVWAAGAAVWDGWARRQRAAAWGRGVVAATILALGVAMLPPSLPLFAPATVERFFEAIGESPELEAADAGHQIPLHLLGRLEWDRFGREVLDAVDRLPPEDRARAVILSDHWVEASVIAYHGRDRDAPPSVSPHNAFWFWRDEAAGRDVVVAVGIAESVLTRHFAETRPLARFECEHCANWRRDTTITLARDPVRPLTELLTEWRYFGAGDVPALDEPEEP